MAQCMICFGEFFTHWFVNSMFCCWVGIMFYKDQLGSITCWCCSNFYFYWFLSTSITEKGLLKPITVDLNWYVFPVKSVSFCFVYLETLLLDVYIFRTIMSSPWIDPFIIIKCPLKKKKTLVLVLRITLLSIKSLRNSFCMYSIFHLLLWTFMCLYI